MNTASPFIEILDTTLRDGEQTSEVSFSTAEKMTITRLLLNDLHVPRIEVASARVSEGERRTVERICAWAKGIGRLEAIEVLGFADGGRSVEWIRSTGGRVINLLSKGSERHCRLQLGQTPEEHFALIAAEVERAVQAGLTELVDRGTRMVIEELGLPYDEAKRLLLMHGSVKRAVDAYNGIECED